MNISEHMQKPERTSNITEGQRDNEVYIQHLHCVHELEHYDK